MPPDRPGFALHIHFYVGATLLLICLGIFVIAGAFSYREGNMNAALIGAASAVVAFIALLGLVGRYCSTEQVSYLDGLRLISYYLSIGIGVFSLVFSVVGIGAAILITIFLSLVGVVTNDRPRAQRGFLRLLAFVSSHRMYQ